MEESATHGLPGNLALDIGQRLTEFRVIKGWSREEFARLLGGTKRGLQDNERGETMPGGKLLAHAHALGMNVNWLLSGDGEMLIADMQNPARKTKAATGKDQEDELDSALEICDRLLASRSLSIDSRNKSKLVMLIYDAIKAGICGDDLNKFTNRIGDLLSISIIDGNILTKSDLTQDELSLVHSYRSANSAKRFLMLAHVK